MISSQTVDFNMSHDGSVSVVGMSATFTTLPIVILVVSTAGSVRDLFIFAGFSG